MDLHRLKTFDAGTLSGTTISGTPKREQDFTLDQLGNWSSLTDKTNGTIDFVDTRTHSDANELLTSSQTEYTALDDAGNMTTVSDPRDFTDGYTLKYDAWNRLVEAKRSSTVVQENEYDGLNRRIVRDETGGSGVVTHFYYNRQWQVAEERVGSATTADIQYIYHPNYVDAVAVRYWDEDNSANDVLETDHYYLQDANFNVTAVTDNAGTVKERYSYTPYGEVTVLDPNFSADADNKSDIGNEYLYTGRRVDPETYLQLNRNRFYHAGLGRWVSRDYLEYVDGYNLYQYGGSRVVIALDPMGTKAFGCGPWGAWGPWGPWTSVPSSTSGLCCYVRSRVRFRNCYFCWVWIPQSDTEVSKAKCCTPNPKRIGCVFTYGTAFESIQTGMMCP